MRNLKYVLVLVLGFLLAGCKFAVLDPRGVIADSQAELLLISVGLMLIVVLPTIVMSLFFAWRYRKRHKTAVYAPEFTHSTWIEVVCWAVPCVIIGILAYITWVYTHKLDPYRPIASDKPVLVVQAVALDWKWLFIYPDQHIATVNYVELPVGVPVRFFITSDAPMNSFEMPRLAGQIYAMPGMRSQLNIMADQIGLYDGLSANYSGDGFASMAFKINVTSEADFQAWVLQAQKAKAQLTNAEYLKLSQPSSESPVMYYSNVEPDLFSEIINKYMTPNSKLGVGN